MENYNDVLIKSPLFRDILIEDLGHLLICLGSTKKSFNKDEYIFSVGDEINHIYIVLEGGVELSKTDLTGNKNIVAFLGPSALFAEGVVCTSRRSAPVSAKALEKLTVALIPYERIIETCHKSCGFHNILIRNMMLLLGEKNYTLNHKIDLLMIKGMREKLVTYLLYESKKQNSLSFSIPLNRNEMADYLNVSRPSMSRELARMKDEGLIDYYKYSFKILDLNRIKACLL